MSSSHSNRSRAEAKISKLKTTQTNRSSAIQTKPSTKDSAIGSKRAKKKEASKGSLTEGEDDATSLLSKKSKPGTAIQSSVSVIKPPGLGSAVKYSGSVFISDNSLKRLGKAKKEPLQYETQVDITAAERRIRNDLAPKNSSRPNVTSVGQQPSQSIFAPQNCPPICPCPLPQPSRCSVQRRPSCCPLPCTPQCPPPCPKPCLPPCSPPGPSTYPNAAVSMGFGVNPMNFTGPTQAQAPICCPVANNQDAANFASACQASGGTCVFIPAAPVGGRNCQAPGSYLGASPLNGLSVPLNNGLLDSGQLGQPYPAFGQPYPAFGQPNQASPYLSQPTPGDSRRTSLRRSEDSEELSEEVEGKERMNVVGGGRRRSSQPQPAPGGRRNSATRKRHEENIRRKEERMAEMVRHREESELNKKEDFETKVEMHHKSLELELAEWKHNQAAKRQRNKAHLEHMRLEQEALERKNEAKLENLAEEAMDLQRHQCELEEMQRRAEKMACLKEMQEEIETLMKKQKLDMMKKSMVTKINPYCPPCKNKKNNEEYDADDQDNDNGQGSCFPINGQQQNDYNNCNNNCKIVAVPVPCCKSKKRCARRPTTVFHVTPACPCPRSPCVPKKISTSPCPSCCNKPIPIILVKKIRANKCNNNC